MADLRSACADKSEPPTDIDEPYITKYHIPDSPRADSEFKFGFFITTKKLSGILDQATILHADGTYNLNWNGFPVLVTGTSDSDGHFHPAGLGVTYGETHLDYEFIFSALKEASPEFNPEVLVADNADAIHNAFDAVFGQKIHVNCWAHVIDKAQKRIIGIKSKKIREAVIADIYALQLSKSEAEFLAGKKLWQKKWLNHEATSDFAKYFSEQYLTRHCGWYEGAYLKCPSTNNCLEATNKWIKAPGTFRERLSLDGSFKWL